MFEGSIPSQHQENAERVRKYLVTLRGCTLFIWCRLPFIGAVARRCRTNSNYFGGDWIASQIDDVPSEFEPE